jgi:hypothetical protein
MGTTGFDKMQEAITFIEENLWKRIEIITTTGSIITKVFKEDITSDEYYKLRILGWSNVSDEDIGNIQETHIDEIQEAKLAA